jgi:hypothetical protein
MIPKDLISAVNHEKVSPPIPAGFITLARFAINIIMLAGLALFAYSLAWNFSTRRYLKGFADAIIPLTGSPEERTEALVEWFRHEPRRIDPPVTESTKLVHDRDPVNIVQNALLLKVCGSASNAFVNLAGAAGLNARRLLLLDRSGEVIHVVAEVQWGDRWVVVNPQQGLVFKDHLGRGLTKDELRDREVFRDAISSMPSYDPQYTFENTIHIRLKRIPILGGPLRSVLDRFAPGWEEAINWAYFPENPTLWPMSLSLPLFILGSIGNLIVNRYCCNRQSIKSMESCQ